MELWLAEDSADDLILGTFEFLLAYGVATSPTKGAARETWGACLRLSNPRSRLSRTETRGRVFSCLGELCWYLSRTNDAAHIRYYISHYNQLEENGVIYGGYGRRLFDFDGIDQIRYVIQRLEENPDSRKAVIQIFDRFDVVEHHEDVPCTCTLQFLIRDGALQLVAYMRSNDAYLGLPHDLFAFTMLQEIVAVTLAVPLGTYTHAVGSLHLYDRDVGKPQALIAEGWQSNIPMPAMPAHDPWPEIEELLELEAELRRHADPRTLTLPEDPYWADLARLLQIFALDKRGDRHAIPAVRAELSHHDYTLYIDDRLER